MVVSEGCHKENSGTLFGVKIPSTITTNFLIKDNHGQMGRISESIK